MSLSLPGYIFQTTSLCTYLDRTVLVMLLDGRIIIGIMRSFDVFGNTVLESAFERIVAGNEYCDKPMGLFIGRGENVVLIGEQDFRFPLNPPHLTAVSLPHILTAKKAERESSQLKRTLKKWMEEFLDDI